MEIIEKRVYEEGRNNGYDRDRDRSTRERSNAGLTLGIIGTALGAAALWGRGNNGGIGSPALSTMDRWLRCCVPATIASRRG